jgi:DNA polymerase-3 subunit alpha
MAGAFDSIGNIKRHQFFCADNNNMSFIENLIRFGNKMQAEIDTAQQSLFGGISAVQVTKPEIPVGTEWATYQILEKEKEVVGMYISAHPLDDFATDIKHFCTNNLSDLRNMNELLGKNIVVAGLISQAEEKVAKNGNRYCNFFMEDYTGNYRQSLFAKDYMKFKNFLTVGYMILIYGKVIVPQWKREQTDAELVIDDIVLLSGARERIKNLTIKLSIDSVSDELINDLNACIKNNKGKTDLRFLVVNHEDRTGIELYSRSNSIHVSNELIRFLENNSLIEYTLT